MNRVITSQALPTLPEPARAAGVVLRPAGDCLLPGEIGPEDLVMVDFDQHQALSDGLYLLERIGPLGVEWRGCRRISLPLLHARLLRIHEGSEWKDAPDLMALNLRIAGRVLQVYSPKPLGRICVSSGG